MINSVGIAFGTGGNVYQRSVSSRKLENVPTQSLEAVNLFGSPYLHGSRLIHSHYHDKTIYRVVECK